MITRGIDGNNDWLFGKSKQDYKREVDAVAQSVKTRLQSFLGDCFFDLGAGIDWFNLLGSKDVLELRLNIQAVILNTPSVTSINEIDFKLDESRNMLVSYEVTTIYGVITQDDFIEISPIISDDNFNMLLENGFSLLQQDQGEILI